MTLGCLLKLTTRLVGLSASEPVVVRHRASGCYVARGGATADASGAVQFESEAEAQRFVASCLCEPAGFELLAAAAAAKAA